MRFFFAAALVALAYFLLGYTSPWPPIYTATQEFWNNDGAPALASNDQCMHASHFSAASQLCNTSVANLHITAPAVINATVHTITCFAGIVPSNAEAGDTVEWRVRWRDIGGSVSDSTNALSIDISGLSQGEPRTATINEAAPTSDSYPSLHIDTTVDAGTAMSSGNFACLMTYSYPAS